MRERTIQLDETDWRIIRALRENARATFTEIGRAVGLTSPAARERVRRMEEAGLIEGYRPVFNYSVMGFGIKAIILMKSKSDSRVAEKHYFRLLPAVRELEGIVRAWDVTGDVVCIAEAAVPSMKEPKAKAMKMAWRRRSSVNRARDCLMYSNSPDSTVIL